MTTQRERILESLKTPRERGLVHLQFVGDVPGVPAAALKPGDKVMWNGGGVYTVTAVRDVSPKFMEIDERGRDGTDWPGRKMRKDRLVARVCAHCERFTRHHPNCPAKQA